MAKTKHKNKSRSIREYLTANPESKAKAVVEALAKAARHPGKLRSEAESWAAWNLRPFA